MVDGATDQAPAAVVADPRSTAEEALIADSLVAMKLLSSSAGADAPNMAAVAQGYDALRLAAAGRDPVGLRVLSMADYPAAPPSTDPAPGAPPSPPASPTANDPSGASATLADLDLAIKALTSQSSAGFQQVVALSVGATDTRSAKRSGAVAPTPITAPPPAGVPSIPIALATSRPWVMSAPAVAALPAKVRAVLTSAGLDPSTQALPRLIEQLQARRAQLQFAAALSSAVRPGRLIKVGNSFDPIVTSDYVGSPGAGLPTGHGNVRPVGIGDLLMVKEHILRYEGGELAHVENVLKSEHLSRKTRRLERTETTILQESETTKEETRDTQTTDRFSLKRETSDTIKTDTSLKAGLSVDASYGPTVEVKATTDFSTSGSSESSTKTASEFSKDVVDRSVSSLVERVLERRTTTTISEFEEKYSHGFDNTAGSGHISGFYQWIDKIMQAQVYNYGKRLLFDVTVPEPGTNFMLALTRARDVGQALEMPEPFTATALDINEGNYAVWAKKYDATGLEPPPPPIKTVVQAIDGVFSQDGHESSKSVVLAIDEGYRARYASFVKDAVVTDPQPQWRVFVGGAFFDAMTAQQYVDLAGEIGSIGFAYDAHGINVMSASIEVFCERTERALTTWQLKTHAAITQAFQAKMQIYDQALAQARAEAETVIAGRNPAFNQRLMSNELRRRCLTMVTGQQFEAFGALELAAEGYAQPSLDRATAQMPYVRFFEQAFEWEHLVYFFYPYFWGWKAGWKNRMLLDDVDPVFADFYAPVRRGWCSRSARASRRRWCTTWRPVSCGTADHRRTSPNPCMFRSSARSRRRPTRPETRFRWAILGRCGCRRPWCGCAPTTICPSGRRWARNGCPRTDRSAAGAAAVGHTPAAIGTSRVEVICGPIVRRTTHTTATIWLELSADGVVAGRAKLSENPPGVKPTQKDWIGSDVRYTVRVGGRYYVILTFENLQPGSAYFYRFYVKETAKKRDSMDVVRMKWARVPGVDFATWPELEATIPELFSPTFDLKRIAARGGLPEFRTLPDAGREESRVAFGSCRKRDAGYRGEVIDKGEDVLKLFGQQLRNRPSSRLKDWPQLLLLIGDQIYADDVDRAVVQSAAMESGTLPSLDVPPPFLTAGMKAGTAGFHCSEYEHFAESHVHAWTDPDVRFLFANLPVFMVFDDHEITDDWNITRGWLEQALQTADWADAIRDGLIAYWMYQGWGNPLPAAGWADPRLKVLSDAADGNYDALDALRKVITPQPGQLDYYYSIESDPRIAVLDARHDRAFAKVPADEIDMYVEFADQILGEKQWAWLDKQTKVDGPVVIVTSVPLLQFPYPDLTLLETVRPEGGIIMSIELDRIDTFEAKRRDTDADSWASFPSSFLRLTEVLSGGGPFVLLSGDVHYSYVSFGRVDLPANPGLPR